MKWAANWRVSVRVIRSHSVKRLLVGTGVLVAASVSAAPHAPPRRANPIAAALYVSGPAPYRPQIHFGGQNWLYVDGHAKFKKLGSTTKTTDPDQDPFTYNADGSISQLWAENNGCHRPWLFRADYVPKQ